VNLLGTVATMVYLHQAYGSGVDSSANKAIAQSGATWETLMAANAGPKALTDSKAAAEFLGQIKAITGSDYALLIDKQAVDPAAYAEMREANGLPNNFDEGETYAMLATTNEDWVDEYAFKPAPNDVPEGGKIVGVENGACAETCHAGVTGTGDYWGVRWSDEEGLSEVHSVYPVANGEGKPVAVLYSISDVTDQATGARTSMVQTLLVIGATLLFATLTIGMLIDLLVFKRMNRMMLAIEDVSMRVAGGDFEARFEPDMTNDEIGRFEQFMANVLDLMTDTIKSLVSK
jgi:methyl-accepting chemotaxis protein